jgi:hypothetical protein
MTDGLATALAGLRQAKGWSTREAGTAAGLSAPTVLRCEDPSYLAPVGTVRKLAAALTEDAAEVERLAALAAKARERTATRQVLLQGGSATLQREFARIESESGHVQTFHPAMVPGLLQSPAYARLVMGGNEDAVAARLARQRILDGPDGPRVTQIIGDGALRWPLGGPGVMAEQCALIAQAARRAEQDTDGRVRIGIIPWWANGVTRSPMHGFDLYDADEVIVGTRAGTAWITNRPAVQEFVGQFRAFEDAVSEAGAWGSGCAEIVQGVGAELERVARDGHRPS